MNLKGWKVSVVLGFAFACGIVRAETPPIELVMRQLMAYYTAEGRIRYNHTIDFEVVKNDEFNAYASYNGSYPTLKMFTALLDRVDTDEALIVLCHELGHALGDLPYAKYDPVNFPGDPLSLEGEADYYAGKCAVDYYQQVEGLGPDGSLEKTLSASHRFFSQLYGVEVRAQSAAKREFNGVKTDYPDPDCRALTVWAGAEGLPRPKCWYNPR